MAACSPTRPHPSPSPSLQPSKVPPLLQPAREKVIKNRGTAIRDLLEKYCKIKALLFFQTVIFQCCIATTRQIQQHQLPYVQERIIKADLLSRFRPCERC